MRKIPACFLFVAVFLFYKCGNDTPSTTKPETVSKEPVNPFIKLPLSFCSTDSSNSFTLTLDSMVNYKLSGNWFRLAGQTENGQDAREDEDIKSISYDTTNSTLSFVSPFSEDSTRIVFTCIKREKGTMILVSKNFEYADTLVECKR